MPTQTKFIMPYEDQGGARIFECEGMLSRQDSARILGEQISAANKSGISKLVLHFIETARVENMGLGALVASVGFAKGNIQVSALPNTAMTKLSRTAVFDEVAAYFHSNKEEALQALNAPAPVVPA